jgi:hypothetical protein
LIGQVLRAVPLLGFVLLLANVLALLGSGFDTELLAFALPSGATLALDAGDLVVLSGLLLLTVEVIKSSVASAPGVFDHALSFAVFACALLEFLLLARFAHGAFLALLAMTLIDAVAGSVLAWRTRRRFRAAADSANA